MEKVERPSLAEVSGLSARSVLASWLLGSSAVGLPADQLIRLAGLLGINENGTRVALSRMVAAGEATKSELGLYQLSGRLVERGRRQEESRRWAPEEPWTGDWVMVMLVVRGSTPPDRVERRKALKEARMGELREGVWCRPANLEIEAGLRSMGELWLGRPGRNGRSLARELFDLDRWADEARTLAGALADVNPERMDELAAGFVVSARVLRHLHSDPLLPRELEPAGWPGADLRERYKMWDSRYRWTLKNWTRQERDPS